MNINGLYRRGYFSMKSLALTTTPVTFFLSQTLTYLNFPQKFSYIEIYAQKLCRLSKLDAGKIRQVKVDCGKNRTGGRWSTKKLSTTGRKPKDSHLKCLPQRNRISTNELRGMTDFSRKSWGLTGFLAAFFPETLPMYLIFPRSFSDLYGCCGTIS